MIKIEPFSSAIIRRLNLHIKDITKYEAVAKLQDTHVTKLWGKYHVKYYRNLPVLSKYGQL